MRLSKLRRSIPWIKADFTPTEEFAQSINEIIQVLEDMFTNKQLYSGRPDMASAEIYYTAPASAQSGRGTTITQFSATDPAAGATYNVYIGKTADDTTLVVSAFNAPADGVGPESVIGLLIPPEHSLWLEPSAIDTIVFNVAGNERTG